MKDDTMARLASLAAEGGPDCPDCETLRRHLEGESAPVTDVHVQDCPRCRLELEELRAFLAPAAVDDDTDVQRIRSRLHASLATGADPATEHLPASRVGFPPVSRQRWPVLAAAATVLVVVAVGIVLNAQRAPGPPPLPAPGTDLGPWRGGAVAREPAPEGALAVAPAELTWLPADPSADGWHVRLLVDAKVLVWSTRVAAPPAVLPAEVVAALAAGRRYTWEVERGDGAGTAVSAVFWLEPGDGNPLVDSPEPQ